MVLNLAGVPGLRNNNSSFSGFQLGRMRAFTSCPNVFMWCDCGMLDVFQVMMNHTSRCGRKAGKCFVHVSCN